MRKLLAVMAFLCLLLMAVPLLPRNGLPGWEPPDFLPAADAGRIQKEIIQAVALCREAAGSNTDTLEARLIGAGFATVDTDESYPAHLANPEGLREFWDAVSSGEDAAQTVLRVSEDSGLNHMFFFREKGEDYFLLTTIRWDDSGECYVSGQEILPIYEMELADWDIFYYRLYPKDDPHYIDYTELRLTPADRELYDLNRKYILPVGYQMVNLFLVNWQEGDWGELAFNDVFEYLYEIYTGEAFPWEQFPFQFEPIRATIPAELFEETVLPYFQISLEDLREACQYDEASTSYPWRPVYGNDLTAWKDPIRQPEVVDAAHNADGTMTLTVQVHSPEVKTDRLFIHEVTLRPMEDGGFQYVGNKVTYISEWGLPYSGTRFALDGE